MTVHVVGHSNPDTDSVTSAISFAALLQAQGQDAQPCMQC
ncbi:MAG TPA: manganese-dependent inorganic pyrophosphatase, partial [Desulfofustis sp.]|nr:manganese-dependent inorganic pyrophosphatase [Desulfofustis sp.]